MKSPNGATISQGTQQGKKTHGGPLNKIMSKKGKKCYPQKMVVTFIN